MRPIQLILTTLFKDTENMLGQHPFIGAWVAATQVFIGKFMIAEMMIVPFVKDVLQMLAWIGAISVSIVTVIGWLKTNTRLFDKCKIFKNEK